MNKKTLLIIITLGLLLAGYLVAKVPFNSELSAVSALFVVLMALPSYVILVRWLGQRRGLITLAILSLYALGLETLAIMSGFPYGEFTYSGKIGERIFGVTPWTVPFGYVPLVLGAYSFAWKYADQISTRIILTAATLVATDVLLDPGAVALDFWRYAGLDFWYGVPWTNYLGWLGSGTVAASLIYYLAWPRASANQPPPQLLQSSLFFILVFWSQVAYHSNLAGPTIVGLVLCVLVGARLFKALEFRDWLTR